MRVLYIIRYKGCVLKNYGIRSIQKKIFST